MRKVRPFRKTWELQRISSPKLPPPETAQLKPTYQPSMANRATVRINTSGPGLRRIQGPAKVFFRSIESSFTLRSHKSTPPRLRFSIGKRLILQRNDTDSDFTG